MAIYCTFICSANSAPNSSGLFGTILPSPRCPLLCPARLSLPEEAAFTSLCGELHGTCLCPTGKSATCRLLRRAAGLGEPKRRDRGGPQRLQNGRLLSVIPEPPVGSRELRHPTGAWGSQAGGTDFKENVGGSFRGLHFSEPPALWEGHQRLPSARSKQQTHIPRGPFTPPATRGFQLSKDRAQGCSCPQAVHVVASHKVGHWRLGPGGRTT